MSLVPDKIPSLSSLTFFFPFKHPSGVSNVFLCMARFLAVQYPLQVSLVDYPDGQMARQLTSGDSVHLVPFKDGQPLIIATDTVLVMQSGLPYAMRPELRVPDTTRIILWDFLFFSMVNTICPFEPLRRIQNRSPKFYRAFMSIFMPRLLRDLERFLNSLMAKRAILFQDRYNYFETIEFLRPAGEEPTYLPAPIQVPPAPPERKPHGGGWLRLGWIGRLYDFKIHILWHTLERASRLAMRRRLPIRFLIVGDGDYAEKLSSHPFGHEWFEVNQVGAVPSASLPEFILTNMDLLLAMGTSALEGARLGLPTVLLDYAFAPLVRPYRFKWLFEVTPGDIGHQIGEEDYEPAEESLDYIIDGLLEPGGDIARRCFEHCRAHHGLEAVAAKFMENLEGSSFRFGDTPPRLRQKNLIRKMMDYRRYGWRELSSLDRTGRGGCSTPVDTRKEVP
jgi:hypothetical protein